MIGLRDQSGNIQDGSGPPKTLIGGPGDDLFIVDDLGDLVIEINGGIDIVETSVDYTRQTMLRTEL